MKKIIIVLIVLAVAGGAYYYFIYPKASQMYQQPSSSTQTQTTQTSENTNIATGKNFDVSIAGFAFNPKNITVSVGDTITWTNNDSAPHQLRGDNLSTLYSIQMPKGQTYGYTFDTAGTYTYHCTIHPSMKGTIIVK